MVDKDVSLERIANALEVANRLAVLKVEYELHLRADSGEGAQLLIKMKRLVGSWPYDPA